MSQISLVLPLFLVLSDVTNLLQICCHRSSPDLLSQISSRSDVTDLLGSPCVPRAVTAHISAWTSLCVSCQQSSYLFQGSPPPFTPHPSFSSRSARAHFCSAPINGRQRGRECLFGFLTALAGQLPLEAAADRPGPTHWVEGPVGGGGDDGGRPLVLLPPPAPAQVSQRGRRIRVARELPVSRGA